MDNVDAGELKEVDIIQGIKSTLLLLGNVTAAFFAATENDTPTLEPSAEISFRTLILFRPPTSLGQILESWLRNGLKQLP